MANNSLHDHVKIMREASLRDIAAAAGEKVGAITGDDKAKGKVDARKLKNYLIQQYNKWLGQTGNELDEESLMTFLTAKIGFTPANIRKIFDRAGIDDPTRTNESLNEAINKSDLDRVMTAAAQFAFAHDLVGGGANSEFNPISNARSDAGTTTRRTRSSNASNSADDIVSTIRKSTGDSNSYSVDKAELVSQLQSTGLSREFLGDLKDIVEKLKDYKDIKKMPDRNELMNQLAKVGFAFFKSTR